MIASRRIEGSNLPFLLGSSPWGILTAMDTMMSFGLMAICGDFLRLVNGHFAHFNPQIFTVYGSRLEISTEMVGPMYSQHLVF